MENELSSILESIDKEIFTEDVKKQLSAYVESLTEKKAEKLVSERTHLAVEAALKTQDEDYARKLAQYAEAVDIDRTNKTKLIVKHLNEDFKAKMKQLSEAYESILKKKAVDTQMHIVRSVDAFLDQYIEQTCPVGMIAEAAKNNIAAKTLDSIRNAVGIDAKLVSENVKTAVKDGKAKIDALAKEKQRLARENANIKKAALLAEATINLPKAKAKFIVEQLKDKPLDFVKANIKFVSEMFDRPINRRQSAFDATPVNNVDRQKVADELIRENAENQPTYLGSTDAISMYMEGLKHRR